MAFEVRYKPEAEAQLIDIWMNSADRDAVRRATEYLDWQLTTSADTAGEARHGRRRIVFDGPLVYFYDLDTQAKVVNVAAVKKYGKKR